MSSVEVKNLQIRYGDKVVLNDLSFNLDGDKIYGLLGRNASGKTSLLSVLAAFRKPSSGEILIGGSPVWEDPEITQQVCLIRESGDVLDSENIAYALDFAADTRPQWDAEYAEVLVSRFNLPKKQGVSKLSRGQRSALGIVLGLASRAPLTMFDESYLGLDAPARYIFYEELLADFMRVPRTIIVSTHLIEEVSSLLEEVLIIGDGRLLLHEDAESLRAFGSAVIGPAAAVKRFTAGMNVLSTKELGPTMSAVALGEFSESRLREAREAGLELSSLPLQDLFVHLTTAQGEKDAV